LLLNALFVVLMAPPRKPRSAEPVNQPGKSLAALSINKNVYPSEDQELLSLRQVIILVGMGTFFALSSVLLEAIGATRRFFKRGRDQS
jgi:hypothetical protein